MTPRVVASRSFERILIIGGRSFFAEHFYVEARSRYPSAQIVRTSRFESSEADWIRLDTADWESVQRAVRYVKPDLVINSSGAISGSFHYLMGANAVSSALIGQAVGRIVPEARLILLGSAAEYGVTDTPVGFSESSTLRGSSLYAMSKKAQHSLMPSLTKIARNTLYLRVFNIFGPNMPDHLLFGKVQKALTQRVANEDTSPIDVGFLGDYRDFIDVRDAARLTFVLAETPLGGQTINVASGRCKEVRKQLNYWLHSHSAQFPDIEIREKSRRTPNYSLARITKLEALVKGHK